MNIVVIDGFLGQNPKITETDKGPCCTLQIANHDRKDGKATWIPLVAFGNKVNLMGKTIHKGDKIVLQGRIRMREVENRYLEVEVTFFEKIEKLRWDEDKTPNTSIALAFEKAANSNNQQKALVTTEEAKVIREINKAEAKTKKR